MAKGWVLAAGLLIMTVPQLARAEPAPPTCTAQGKLPPQLSAWTMLAYRNAATGAAGLSDAQLKVGETARVTLLLRQAVAYPLQPEKTAAPDTFGGLLQFVVPAQGSYRVVLGSRAWIDVVAPDGKAVASGAHSMVPPCTGIRKMVDFTLAPGAYTIQLSGNPEPATSVLVIRLS